MKKTLNILALTFGASLAATLSGQAQLLVSEGFDYAAGNGVLAAEGTGGTGWAASWTDKNNLSTSSASSLSYTDGSGNTLSTSGGSLIAIATTTSQTTEPQRQLASTFGAMATANTAQPDTLWMSYLWQGLNTSSTGSLFRQASVMLLQGTKEYLDIGMPNISSGTVGTVNPDISLWAANGIAVSPPTSTAPLDSGVAANNGATDFVLIEMTGTWVAGSADTINVWINPALTGATPVGSPQLTYSGQDLSGINYLRIQASAINSTYGAAGGEEQVDEINIGDTALDVEPVPEPASLTLVALGGALLIWRRKQ